jgi:hypothetical protein
MFDVPVSIAARIFLSINSFRVRKMMDPKDGFFGGGLTGSLAALRSDVLRARRETQQSQPVSTRVKFE